MTSLDKATAIRMFREIKDQLQNIDAEKNIDADEITITIPDADGEDYTESLTGWLGILSEGFKDLYAKVEVLEPQVSTLQSGYDALLSRVNAIDPQ